MPLPLSSATPARHDRSFHERLADQKDPVDRERLVERFVPLARSLALRYARAGEPFDDVFQVACIGLIKAIDRFDVSRGRAFSSFAVPTIVGEIKRHYRDRTWSVHVPRDLHDLVLATDVGVYVSGRSGGTWSRVGSGLPNVITSDLSVTPDGRLLAATHGRGLWVIPLSGLS